MPGDRLWAIRDPHGQCGSGKSSRRFERMDGLLRFGARLDGHVPVMAMPDGAVVRGDDPAVHDARARGIGRAVTLAHEEAVAHVEERTLSLLTTASLATVAAAVGAPVHARRFRANVRADSLDGIHGTGVPRMDYPKDAWVGRRRPWGRRWWWPSLIRSSATSW